MCSYLALGSCSDQRGGPRLLLLPRAREVPVQRVPSQPPAPRVTGQQRLYERASEYFCCFFVSYLSLPPGCRSRARGVASCHMKDTWVPHPRRQEPRLPPGIQPHRTRTHDARPARSANAFFYPLLRQDALPSGNIARKSERSAAKKAKALGVPRCVTGLGEEQKSLPRSEDAGARFPSREYKRYEMSSDLILLLQWIV